MPRPEDAAKIAVGTSKFALFRHPAWPRASAGFSLMETIMAGFIVSLVIIFLANLFPVTLYALRHSENRTQANLLAQSLLESMRTAPFAQLAALPPGQVTNDGVVYRFESAVEDVAGADPRFLKRLKVQVRWQARSEEKSLTHEVLVHAVRR